MMFAIGVIDQRKRNKDRQGCHVKTGRIVNGEYSNNNRRSHA